jgi:hypothetical protein
MASCNIGLVKGGRHFVKPYEKNDWLYPTRISSSPVCSSSREGDVAVGLLEPSVTPCGVPQFDGHHLSSAEVSDGDLELSLRSGGNVAGFDRRGRIDAGEQESRPYRLLSMNIVRMACEMIKNFVNVENDTGSCKDLGIRASIATLAMIMP